MAVAKSKGAFDWLAKHWGSKTATVFVTLAWCAGFKLVPLTKADRARARRDKAKVAAAKAAQRIENAKFEIHQH